MAWFVIAIIVWVIALLAVVTGLVSDEKAGPFAGAAAAVIVGFGLFALGGMKSVPVKNIGVPQSFGAVGSSVFEPGIHETWTPWLHLTDINETVQTTTYEGSGCLDVRIGGQQTACADVTIQWQIKPGAASSLFSDYANQGNFMAEITNAVVVREFKQVVNQVLGDYNPITDVQNVSGSSSATSQFTAFGPTILGDMQHDIGSEVEVRSVFLPKITYDAAVEKALEAIQTANANYAVAAENVKVNEENAQGYSKLGAPTVPELEAECLTDLKDGMTAPAGFQCIAGSGSSLAISGK